MALSFRDELQAFITQRLEQQPAVQAALVTGQRSISTQEALDYIGVCLRLYQDAILKIADEVDKLRAASGGG